MAYLSTEETSAITQTGQVESGWKIHLRDSFIHVSVILHISMYVCIYNFLWMILIPSLWSELLEVRWQSLANSVQIQNLLISLSLRNKIILSKLEALVCES